MHRSLTQFESFYIKTAACRCFSLFKAEYVKNQPRLCGFRGNGSVLGDSLLPPGVRRGNLLQLEAFRARFCLIRVESSQTVTVWVSVAQEAVPAGRSPLCPFVSCSVDLVSFRLRLTAWGKLKDKKKKSSFFFVVTRVCERDFSPAKMCVWRCVCVRTKNGDGSLVCASLPSSRCQTTTTFLLSSPCLLRVKG